MSGVEAPLVGAALGETAAATIANPFVDAMATGIGGGMGGGSLFGFDPSLGGFGQGIMEAAQGANQWMGQNPMLTQLGMKAGSTLLQPHQMRPMGGGGQISRGQIPQMDFSSLLNPQQNTVLRPQAMSLL